MLTPSPVVDVEGIVLFHFGFSGGVGSCANLGFPLAELLSNVDIFDLEIALRGFPLDNRTRFGRNPLLSISMDNNGTYGVRVYRYTGRVKSGSCFTHAFMKYRLSRR